MGMSVLTGKSALVTGGGGGFGKASALLLAKDGATVVLMGRSQDKLDRARELMLTQVPGAIIGTVAGDATLDADVERAVEETVALGGSIDMVVGVVGGATGMGPILARSTEDYVNDYHLNVGASFLTVKHAAPRMTRGGSFIFVSSTAAVMPFIGLSTYCAAKAGLDMFMRVAANELGSRNIRVNCVRPGLTHTDGMDAAFERPGYTDAFLPLIPLGRTGVPNDVGEAVRFLAGPESAWLTGQSFAVDGGNELRMAPLPDPALGWN
jgi:NAD(P)-dependent dehydrogenase (short-subunit alcohol dehydrogenase family)